MTRIFFASLFALIISVGTASADPSFWKFEWPKTDFEKSSVNFVEILSGGPPKDGIPSIDDPHFLDASTISTFDEHEPVITLTVNDETKAYPIRVLTWHEIVNDVIGGVPVAVTYCPLCNAAVVFERTVNGTVTEFGVSGKLRNSDMIMYDRETETWWQQFTGEAIVGAQLGTKLKILPSRTESWARFTKRHPNGQVLGPSKIHNRQYGRNPYVNYDSSFKPFLYNGELPDDIPALAYVVAVQDIDQPFVISLEKVRSERSVTRNGVTLTWQDGTRSALDTREIAKGRQIGNVTAKRDGKDVAYDLTFAFVTHAFMPDVPIEK